MLAVALVALLSAASSKPVPWVVLVRSDGTTPAGWTDALQEAARGAAEGTAVKVVPPPAISLDEAQLTLGCGSWSATCAGRIASTMSATTALVVELKAGASETETITWSVVSSSGAMQRRPEAADLPDRGEAGLLVAKHCVAAAIRGTRPTVVVVTTDAPGAQVIIDDVARGKTPLTLVDELTPGPHRLRLSLDGRAPAGRALDVKAGTTYRVDVVLGANPIGTLQPTIGDEPSTTSPGPVVAWTMVGVGAAALVAAAGTGGYWAYQYVDLSKKIAQTNDKGLVVGITQHDADKANGLISALTITTATLVGVGALVAGTGVGLLFVPNEDESP